MFYFPINITFIKRNFSIKKGPWKIDKLSNIKYKIVAISKGVIEFVFIIKNIELNVGLFGIIYNIIINSNELIALDSNTKIILMTGLTDGTWINIGSTLHIYEYTSQKDFEDHYLQALKLLEDKHYYIYNFSFLITKVFIPINKNEE